MLFPFHNVKLPDEIEQESTAGPRFSTSVTVLGNVAEARNQNWQDAKLTADISYGVQRADDGYALVLSFFRARRGRLYAFRYKDWSDFRLTNEKAQAVAGSTTQFQIVKTYQDPLAPFVRRIQLPVVDTLQVKVGSTLTTNFTLDKGVLTFPSAPAGDVLVTCEFDTPMRFDSDELSLSVYQPDASEVQSITLTEVVL